MSDDPVSGQPFADSAGTPWTGRDLPLQPFAGDTGQADPALAGALEAFGAGAASLAEVVRALARARVLVPIVAVLGQDHPRPALARGDLGADMAVVTLTGADGRRALPVFTCLSALGRWDPRARPLPVESARSALAAVDEGCEALVLDASGPVTVVVPRPALWTLAAGSPWVPPAEDGELLALLRAAVHPVSDVRGLRTEPLGPAGLRIVLGVRAGLGRAELDGVLAAVRALVAEVEELVERTERVELKVLPAS